MDKSPGRIDVLEVHIGDARKDALHIGDGVLIPEGVVAGVEAEVDISFI
jgi:hypothetical protein